MTELNAKKGMVRFKTAFGKNNFDFGFIKNISYDGGETTLDQVIVEVREKIKKDYQEQIDLLQMDNKALHEQLDKLEALLQKRVEEWISQ